MRKWQDQAAPDDPESYNDVAGVQPTPYGTYETCSALAQTSTATAGLQVYAFKAQGITVAPEWLVTTTKIYSVSGTTLTDRTNAVTIGTYPFMLQYGDITICCMGSTNATVTSTAGGNFSALAGAPKAEFGVVQRNCVVLFNTDSAPDGWASSDVGDYTNWTTGEAASGRILTTPGWVTAAVPFGNDIIVFKPSAIYRMTYVGGLVKWEVDLIWSGVGCTISTGQTQNYSKYYARQGLDTILFFGQGDTAIFDSGSGSRFKAATSYAYLFDGSSPPRCINPLTTIAEGHVLHDPARDTFTVVPFASGLGVADVVYFYNRRSDMWGKTASAVIPTDHTPIPILGAYYIRQTKSPMPNFWGDSFGNLVKFTTSSNTQDLPAAVIPYVQTMKLGRDDMTTVFSRYAPRFRRLNGGTDGIVGHSFFPSLVVETFRERQDVTPLTTQTITWTATTSRSRFDLGVGGVEANYARFKLSWRSYDAEIDDPLIVTTPGSAE